MWDFAEQRQHFRMCLDQRYLALVAWGFLVPFVWGFSAKWMSVFLGLRTLRANWLLAAVFINLTGLALILAGAVSLGSSLICRRSKHGDRGARHV